VDTANLRHQLVHDRGMVHALTVRRPWAQLIVLGIKNVENRSWAPRELGNIVVHAGLGWDAAAVAVARRTRGRSVSEFEDALHPGTASTGYLGVVNVGAVCRAADDGLTCRCGRWALAGSLHWILSNALPFVAPIPGRGGLGLRPVPAVVTRAALAIAEGGKFA
jgi:hypothetical protein